MKSPTTRAARLRSLAGGTLLLVAGPAAVGAQAAPQAIEGNVVWRQANVYNAEPERTFLGHATNPTAGSGSQGTVSLAGAGTGLFDAAGVATAAVSPTSARGSAATYAFVFPAKGTLDTATGAVDLQGTGTVTFDRYPWLAASNRKPDPVTVVNPRLTWNAAAGTGAVYASGVGVSSTAGSTAGAPYDAATPILSLTGTPGLTTLPLGTSVAAAPASPLVPTLARAGVFDANYAVGVSGPNRTPNNWGGFGASFKLTPVAAPTTPEATTPATQTPTAGTGGTNPPVAQPPAAPAATTITPAPATTQTVKVTLANAPFKAKRAIAIKLRKRGAWTILGDGSVKGKTLTVTVKTGTSLTGEYVLRRVSASSVLPKSKVVGIR